jgi:hypothetical protein
MFATNVFKGRRFVHVVFILLSIFSVTGCDVGKPAAQEIGKSINDVAAKVGVSTDKVVEVVAQSMGTTQEIAKDTLDQLDKAITTLDENSAEWQQVLKDLENNLISGVQATIRNEITNLITNSIASSGAEFRCNTDFIGKRVQESLQQFVAKLLGGELDFEPVFCASVPPIIPFQEVQENHLPAVIIYGYNLNNLSNFKVLLRNDGGAFRDVTETVQNPTNYVLTINLGINGVPLESISNQLDVTWNGDTIYTIGISQPHPPTETPIPTSTNTPIPTPTISPIPPPEFSYLDIKIEKYVPAANLFDPNDHCESFREIRSIALNSGWRVDANQGDYGHLGVSEVEVGDNKQSLATLRDYAYYFDPSQSQLIVSGRVCGRFGDGPGAVFIRTYRIFLIKPSP